MKIAQPIMAERSQKPKKNEVKEVQDKFFLLLFLDFPLCAFVYFMFYWWNGRNAKNNT